MVEYYTLFKLISANLSIHYLVNEQKNYRICSTSSWQEKNVVPLMVSFFESPLYIVLKNVMVDTDSTLFNCLTFR